MQVRQDQWAHLLHLQEHQAREQLVRQELQAPTQFGAQVLRAGVLMELQQARLAPSHPVWRLAITRHHCPH